tara:strand:+ start:2581 stop:3141 length:561 start_codon:yes stop_codon:yes gene_type:complete
LWIKNSKGGRYLPPFFIFALMNYLIFFSQYIYYYLTSTTKHGVHSPFVFKLLEEAIQTKKFYYNGSKKNSALISRLLSHFNPKSIIEIGSHNLSEKSMIYHNYFPNIKNSLIDLIYIHKSNTETLKKALKYMHNNSVLVLNNIHQTKEEWKFIQNHSKVNVSINLFYIGLIFLREEQEEQHFTIRF